MLGPFRGGRTDAVTGVPGRPNEFYFGAVNGGLWKSIDAGRVWEPVFDDQPVASIGAVAVAPVGARHGLRGERRMHAPRLRGLRQRDIQVHRWRTIVDAPRPRRHAAHRQDRRAPAQPEHRVRRGHRTLLRSEPRTRRLPQQDGGKTWQKVLFKNNDVGAIEVQIDPSNPDVVYAGLWNTRRPPWFVYAPSNGPGGGIYKSTDGGDDLEGTDQRAAHQGHGQERHRDLGQPSEPRLRRDRQPRTATRRASRRRPSDAFGAGASGQGGFFRSDDGGAHWTKMSGRPRALGPRLVLRARRVRSREPRHRLRVQRRRDRAPRTAARPGSRCAARRAATTTIRRGSPPTTRTR